MTLATLAMVGCVPKEKFEAHVAEAARERQAMERRLRAAFEQRLAGNASEAARERELLERRLRSALQKEIAAEAARRSELERELSAEAARRAEADERIQHALSQRVDGLALRVDELNNAIREEIARLDGALQSVYALMEEMPLDYHGQLYLATRRITDDLVATAAIKRMRAQIGGREPQLIVLDGVRPDNSYCALGHDVSQRLAAILSAQRLTTEAIRTQDDVELKMRRKVAGTPDIRNEEHLQKIGLEPDRVFYVVGRIEASGTGYRLFYYVQHLRTDAVFYETENGVPLPRTTEVTRKYEEGHLTPGQEKP
ncbi:MAG: hypothetical protein D6760_13655 [Deltaproteobacteria bacterium]|nr:MAG: hypothetical protein D6760_13655 [Deltaproteobacteria bacterium]